MYFYLFDSNSWLFICFDVFAFFFLFSMFFFGKKNIPSVDDTITSDCLDDGQVCEDSILKQLEAPSTANESLLAILCALLALLQNEAIDSAVQERVLSESRTNAICSLLCDGHQAALGSSAQVHVAERHVSARVRTAAAAVLRECCKFETANASANKARDDADAEEGVEAASVPVPTRLVARVQEVRGAAAARVEQHLASPWARAVRPQCVLALRLAAARFDALDTLDAMANTTPPHRELSDAPPACDAGEGDSAESASVPPLPPLRWLAMRRDFVLFASLAAVDGSLATELDQIEQS